MSISITLVRPFQWAAHDPGLAVVWEGYAPGLPSDLGVYVCGFAADADAILRQLLEDIERQIGPVPGDLGMAMTATAVGVGDPGGKAPDGTGLLARAVLGTLIAEAPDYEGRVALQRLLGVLPPPGEATRAEIAGWACMVVATARRIGVSQEVINQHAGALARVL